MMCPSYAPAMHILFATIESVALKSHLRPGSMCMAACADIRQGSELPTYHRVLM